MNIQKWILVSVPAVAGIFALAHAQSSQSSQTRLQPGRHAIYYHPTNFNQALLLDSGTGSVWQLVSGTYKTKTEGKEEEHDYRNFERLGVEGLYKSEVEKFAGLQEIERILQDSRKQAELARSNKLRQEELALIAKLREELETSDVLDLELLNQFATESNRSWDFCNRVKRQWPRYAQLSAAEILGAIKGKYPELASKYPKLFE